MIRINLLGQIRPKAARRPVDTGAAMPLVFIGAGVLLGGLFLFYFYHSWQTQLDQENKRIKTLQAQKTELEQIKQQVEAFEKQKQVKFLGLASRARSPVAPDVPTTAELGLPDLVASAWFALVAPPGTSPAIAQKVSADMAAALKLPDMRAKFLELAADPQGGTPAETAAFIKDEEARWRAVIKSANVTLE